MKKALMFASVASMIDQFNMDNIQILQGLGYQVDVACNFEYGSTTSQDRVNELRKELQNSGVRCYHIPVPRKITAINDMIKAYKETEKLISKNRYDIVHCHSPIGGVIAREACKKYRKAGTKVIYTAHGFHFYVGAPKLNWMIFYPIEKHCAKFTDVLITINKEDCEIAKKFKADKVVYVPGIGIHVDEITSVKVDRITKRKEIGVFENECMLLSVGELNDNKNQEVIIRAIAKINAPLKYIICGKGDKKDYLENLVKELAIEDKVIFAGYRTDIREILKIADIFCFPSKREGLSVALMEAMAAGLPVICSKIRGNTDLIEDGKGGYLVEPDDVDGFTYSIRRIIKDNRIEMGEVNTKKIKNYSIENVKEIMKNIYTTEI